MKGVGYADRPERPGGRHARHRDADTGGGVGAREGSGGGYSDPPGAIVGTDDGSGIRSRIAELRARAAMVRSFEPSATRRLILDIARTFGWSPSEVARLTFADLHYMIRSAEERATAVRMAPRPRARGRRR